VFVRNFFYMCEIDGLLLHLHMLSQPAVTKIIAITMIQAGASITVIHE